MGKLPAPETEMAPRRGGGGAVHPDDGLPAAAQETYEPFRKWKPWLVPAFVVANAAVFVVTMYVNDCPRSSGSCVARFLGRFSFQPIKENLLLGPSSNTLEKMGGLDVSKVVHGNQGWRLIACIWLHAGVVHILANMLSLVFIGIRLEQEFGFVRIGILYIISGLGGSVLSALFIQTGISVGASGALFGLLGAMLSELLTNWTIYENKCAALSTLLFIIVVNIAVGILPHVDNFAHLGGFVSGFLLGFVLLIRPHYGWISQSDASLGYPNAPIKRNRKHKIYQYALWIIAALLLVVGFSISLIMLFRGVNGNDHCSWCHYLSCIPTSKWSCKAPTVDCLATQTGDQLSLSCQGLGRNQTYTVTSPTRDQIHDLCNQLCS